MAIAKYERQVAAQAIQPAKLDNVDVSGGARAWAKAADSLGNAVKSVGEAYTKYREEANELRATDSYNKYVSARNDQMYNQNNGYAFIEGEAAYGVGERSEKDRTKLRDEIEKDLSPAQLKLFRARADSYDLSFSRSLDTHVMGQIKQQKKSIQDAEANIALDGFVKASGGDLLAQSQADLDRHIDTVALNNNWTDVQKENYKMNLYGKAVSGRIEQMMSIPAYYNNPHLALSEFRRFEKMGLVNAKCREAVMKQLKPQLDRIETVGYVDSYMKRIEQSDVNANKGNTQGKIFTGSQIISQVWNDKNIPLDKRALVIAGISQRYEAQKAAYVADYAQNKQSVIQDVIDGKDPTQSKNFALLTAEDQRKVVGGGSLFGSDNPTIVGFIQYPEKLTISSVDEAFKNGKLSFADYKAWHNKATELENTKKKNIAEWERKCAEVKVTDGMVQEAMRLGGDSDAYGSSESAKKARDRYHAAVTQLANQWKQQNPGKMLTQDVVNSLYKQAKTEVTREVSWWFDSTDEYAEIFDQDAAARAGLGDPYAVEKMVIRDDNGQDIENSKAIIDKVRSSIATRRNVPVESVLASDVLMLLSSMKRNNPEKYQKLMKFGSK